MRAHWLATALCLAAAGAAQADAPVDNVSHTELRVCADPGNLPFSNDKLEGFENKIAQRLAKDLGETVSYTWFPDSQGFIRATLFRHRCDVVIGTVAGNGDLETSNPYYEAGFMLVTRTADNMKATAIGDPSFQGARIGLIARTPPTDLVVKHNMLRKVRPYPLVVDTRIDHPSEDMLKDLADKKIDVAMVWGPYAGYYVKHDNLPLTVAPLDPEGGRTPMRFQIAMGVRPSDHAFLKRVNDVIAKDQAGFTSILTDYGIPIVSH